MKVTLGSCISAVVLFTTSSLLACNCVSKSLEEYKSEADVVFIGVASGVEYGDRGGQAQLKVIEKFKGRIPSLVTIVTPPPGGACGVFFSKDDQYLIYGHGKKGTYSADICTGSRRISEAKDHLIFLKGKK